MIENNFGKKVFFLYPHSVIESDLLHELIMSEYEVYILKDYKQVKLILKKYTDSIIFINIDEHLNEKEWYEFIESIQSNTSLKNIQIGILTYNENEELQRKYLMDINVTCGFIQLKLGKEESKNIILKMLEVNECKGKRKYIRATSLNKQKAAFNVKIGNDLKFGTINDISSVGMSCIFDEQVKFEKNTLLRKIQLKLNGMLILVDAIVFGSREIENNLKLIVVMFTNSMTEDSKSKIHKYIGEVLQTNIEHEIADLYKVKS